MTESETTPTIDFQKQMFDECYNYGLTLGKNVVEKLLRPGVAKPSELSDVRDYILSAIRLGIRDGVFESLNTTRTTTPGQSTAAPGTPVVPSVPNTTSMLLSYDMDTPSPVQLDMTAPQIFDAIQYEQKVEAQPVPPPVSRPKTKDEEEDTIRCACGCGAIIPRVGADGKLRKYYPYHMLVRCSEEKKKADAEKTWAEYGRK